MSFILDALTKAERVRSRIPTLATVHAPARETARAIGLGLAAGVLLAGGGLLVWFFWPPPNGAPPAATDFHPRVSATTPAGRVDPERKMAPAEPEDGPPPAFVARVPRSPDTGREREAPRQSSRTPLAQPRSIQAPPPQASVSGGFPGGAGTTNPIERRRVESRPIEPRRAEPTPVEGGLATPRPAGPSPPSQAGPSQAADRTRADVVVPSAPSLPATPTALHEAMAKMTLDVLVYTNVKAERMVVINGRRYAEGQYVDGLYLLEEITSQGVALSYQGERALLRP
jgi:hypothetical protein